MSTAGAVYLARERAELVRDDEPEPEPVIRTAEPDQARYPITDCMSDKSVVQWWLVLRSFGLTH